MSDVWIRPFPPFHWDAKAAGHDFLMLGDNSPEKKKTTKDPDDIRAIVSWMEPGRNSAPLS